MILVLGNLNELNLLFQVVFQSHFLYLLYQIGTYLKWLLHYFLLKYFLRGILYRIIILNNYYRIK